MIEPGEIVHCNLTFLTRSNKKIEVKDTVLGRPYEGEFQTTYKMESNDDSRSLIRYKIDEDVELIKVEVIKSLGFKKMYQK